MPTTLISDTFTAADTTNVNGRTPSPTNTPGSTWSVFDVFGSGGIQIFANRAYGLAANAYALIDAGVADGTVQATFRADGSLTSYEGALAFRSTSAANRNNCWIADIDHATNHFTLYKIESNGFTPVDQISFTVAQDTDYTIVAVLSGSDISVTVTGGSRALVATDATFATATIHGVGLVGNGTDTAADAFLVTVSSGGGITPLPGAGTSAFAGAGVSMNLGVGMPSQP